MAGNRSTQGYSALEIHAAPAPNASHGLKPNTYDAMALSLTKLNDPASGGTAASWIAFFIAFVFHLIAMILQMGLIFMLLQLTIERREDKWELDLRGEMKGLIEAVTTDKPLNNVTDAKVLKLCADDHNIPYSQSVMTWLWGVKVLPALVQSMWLFFVVLRLPRAKPGDSLIEKEKGSQKESILRLSTCVKLFLVLLVDLPRIGVCIYLYCMGMKFLMYAGSLGTLILKSVGLVFIATIPDILYLGLFSEAFKTELGKVQIRFNDGSTEGQVSASSFGYHWHLWISSVARFALVVIPTLIYCRIICANLQAFRAACTAYEYHFLVPECSPKCGSHLGPFTFYN